MSSAELDREPIELVEFTLPKCANIYGTSPCTATGSGDAKCYNTRATCVDPDNYRDTPDRHLTADLTVTDGDTILSTDVTRTDSIFAAFNVQFGSSPSGTIWMQGSNASSAYLGITAGNIVFRVGTASTAAIVSTSATPYIGKSIILYAEIDYSASPNVTISLWAFDIVELTNVLLGTSTVDLTVTVTVTPTGESTDVTTSISGTEYRIITWLASGSVAVSGADLAGVEYLLVGAGGGAGGANFEISGGGGGGGELITNLGGTAVSVAVGSETITVGTGGAGGDGPTDGIGGTGGTTTAFSASAGGGGGGGGGDANVNATAGTGGGGGGGGESGGTGAASIGTAGDGANGSEAGNYSGGGGGAVDDGLLQDGGDGGSNAITGSATFYGGGGAGNDEPGTATVTTGIGGLGGGADGSTGASGGTGISGTDGLGGGGGGYTANVAGGDGNGGDGGDGIVIMRFPTANLTLTEPWADTTTGVIGDDTGTPPSGQTGGDWNGAISVAYFYDSQEAPADMSDNFRQVVYLGTGEKGEPSDEIYILPCLKDLGTMGAKLNLSGSDDDYEPLGRRSTLDFTCSDFVHSDITQDPYLSDRESDPRTKGTFWRKWLARQKFGRVSALVRVLDGYSDQPLSEYKRRAYFMDKAQYTEDGIAFHARDVLSKTEFNKAQIPAASSGVLAADITDIAATSFTVTGDVTADYPASGTVRINDEIITYTTIAYAAPVTTFSGAVRGSDGSVADTHNANDLVQLCRRYTAASISDVFTEWLIDDAGIAAQFVNIAGIETEDAAYLSAYTITTLLTEPRGVSSLIGQLSAECSFYTWWDERAQFVDLKAIRAIAFSDVVETLTHEGNIIGGTFKIDEKPKQRLNIITVYFNPIDFGGDLDKPNNFSNAVQVVNGTTSLPEQYGNTIQTRTLFSRFLTTDAQVNQTAGRLALRYADVPMFAEFYVDGKDRDIWIGDVVRISHPLAVTARGDRLVKNWLVVEAEEVDPGHVLRYVCADISLDGFIYFITENSITEYDAALFELGNAFITDNAGLNPDGTTGATIS